MEAIAPDGPEPFIATTKDWKQRKALRDRPPPRGRIPEKLDVRERIRRLTCPSPRNYNDLIRRFPIGLRPSSQ